MNSGPQGNARAPASDFFLKNHFFWKFYYWIPLKRSYIGIVDAERVAKSADDNRGIEEPKKAH